MDEVGGGELFPMTWDFFNELLMIGSIGKFIMSFSGVFFCKLQRPQL